MSEDYTWDETVTAHGYAVQNAGLKRDNATLAQRVMELERENAAATKLLDSCLKFFDALDDNYPPALDYAIRHFKRQAAGEISWDESSDQTLRRELTAALLGKDGDL